jgi:hypothetical protein
MQNQHLWTGHLTCRISTRWVPTLFLSLTHWALIFPPFFNPFSLQDLATTRYILLVRLTTVELLQVHGLIILCRMFTLTHSLVELLRVHGLIILCCMFTLTHSLVELLRVHGLIILCRMFTLTHSLVELLRVHGLILCRMFSLTHSLTWRLNLVTMDEVFPNLLRATPRVLNFQTHQAKIGWKS